MAGLVNSVMMAGKRTSTGNTIILFVIQLTQIHFCMKLIKTLKDYILLGKYNIGFIDGDIKSVFDNANIKVNWLHHNYKDRWFADPFILDVTDTEIIVLVEEWYDPFHS